MVSKTRIEFTVTGKNVENVENQNRFPHFHSFQNVFEHTSVQKYFRSLFVEKGLKSIILRTIQQK